MPSPDGGDPVFDGKKRVRVLGDVKNAEIIFNEREGQAEKSEQQEKRLGLGGRPGQGDPVRTLLMCSEQGQRALKEAYAEGKNQGKVSEFGNHWELLPGARVFPVASTEAFFAAARADLSCSVINWNFKG